MAQVQIPDPVFVSDTLTIDVQSLQCTICLNYNDKLWGPEICMHIVCDKCRPNLQSYGSSCPTCRAPVAGTWRRNAFAERLVKQLKTRCQNDGCKAVIELGDHVAHYKVCRFRMVDCALKPMGCKWRGSHVNYDIHSVECKFHSEKCVWCKNNFPCGAMEFHRNTCPLMQVRCRECMELYPVWLEDDHTCKKQLNVLATAVNDVFRQIIDEDRKEMTTTVGLMQELPTGLIADENEVLDDVRTRVRMNLEDQIRMLNVLALANLDDDGDMPELELPQQPIQIPRNIFSTSSMPVGRIFRSSEPPRDPLSSDEVN